MVKGLRCCLELVLQLEGKLTNLRSSENFLIVVGTKSTCVVNSSNLSFELCKDGTNVRGLRSF